MKGSSASFGLPCMHMVFQGREEESTEEKKDNRPPLLCLACTDSWSSAYSNCACVLFTVFKDESHLLKAEGLIVQTLGICLFASTPRRIRPRHH